jgi:hypothetical protein
MFRWYEKDRGIASLDVASLGMDVSTSIIIGGHWC